MKDKTIKVGIAGAGFMGGTHAENYLMLPNVELYALAEQNQHKQKEFLNQYKVKKIYDDVFEMINDEDIDVVDICLPTPLHAKTAVAALHKNKNVLLEKPVALNLEDALLIKEAACQSSGKFMVAHVLRFWPEYLTVRQVINGYVEGSKIREVFATRFNELPLWSDGTWIMSEDKSGGIIVDLMIHDIDYILWNWGEVKRVFCNSISNGQNFPIQALAILEMKNGTVAYIEGGYLNPKGCGLSTQMKLYAENTLIETQPLKKTIKLTRTDNNTLEIPVSGNDGYFEEINYFIDCVRNNRQVKVITTDDAIESLKVCLSLKKSLKENRWIQL
ncbi:MAG: Gfo/Idh/MocA family oxidoreductase [Bacteroidota bacterium]|nr:Gfo/Idh/MocA family oxidoreductase [Bacteroidota bacterium]